MVVETFFEFIGSNKKMEGQSQSNNFNQDNSFGGMNFDEDMIPVDDGDMPF